MLTNEAYNTFKQLVLLWLPGAAVSCFILFYIWDFPSTKLAIGICVFISFLLGIIMTISEKRYRRSNYAYDGQIIISELEEGRKRFSLELAGDPEELEAKESVTFRIAQAEPSIEEIDS